MTRANRLIITLQIVFAAAMGVSMWHHSRPVSIAGFVFIVLGLWGLFREKPGAQRRPPRRR